MEEELRTFLGLASPSIKIVCSLLCIITRPTESLWVGQLESSHWKYCRQNKIPNCLTPVLPPTSLLDPATAGAPPVPEAPMNKHQSGSRCLSKLWITVFHWSSSCQAKGHACPGTARQRLLFWSCCVYWAEANCNKSVFAGWLALQGRGLAHMLMGERHIGKCSQKGGKG